MGKMRQLVMLNRKRETSRLVISDKTKDRQLDIKEAEFELVTTVEEYEKDINDFQLHGGHRGHKSKIRVYFENPYMNYQVWRCKNSEEIVVTRKRYKDNSYLVKIIDYMSKKEIVRP